MQLFDDFVRTDDSPDTHAGRLYPFLNRSSWLVCDRARTLCEDWFSRYPANDQEDLLGRFTSKRDEDHRSAYFELLLHELLLQLGATLTVHPSVPGTSKRPDFLVDLEGTRFYLEAMVNYARDDNFGESPIIDEVCDWIDSMDIPDYLIHIFFSDIPANTPSKAGIIAQIEQFIKASDERNDTIYLDFLKIDDVYARVRLYPRPGKEQAANRRRNVIRSTGGVARSLVPKWHESVRDKAKSKEIERYDAPCVIAINVMDGFAKIRDQGVQAVYGMADHSERRSGLWTGASGSSWRDNLSAVWMFELVGTVQASPSGVEDYLLLKPSVAQQLPTRLTQMNHIKLEHGALKGFDGLVLDELLEVPHIPYEELRRSSSPVC